MSDQSPPRDPGRELWVRLVRQHAKSPNSLTDEELTYFAICLLDGETFINGISGYFESASSNLYDKASRGLEELGAGDVSALVLKAKGRIFGDADVPADIKRRQVVVRQMCDRGDEALEAELKEIGRKMFALSPALGARLEAYARQCGFWPENHD